MAQHRASWLLAVAALAGCASGSGLRGFSSDGCSLFADGTPSDQSRWLHCCTEHDRRYWRGGTREDRKRADETLRACVAWEQDPALASLMYRGVRAGGSPWWPTSHRWAYGWPYGRGYEPLTPEEAARAETLLRQFEADALPQEPRSTPRGVR